MLGPRFFVYRMNSTSIIIKCLYWSTMWPTLKTLFKTLDQIACQNQICFCFHFKSYMKSTYEYRNGVLFALPKLQDVFLQH